jgi:hypothetical protein
MSWSGFRSLVISLRRIVIFRDCSELQMKAGFLWPYDDSLTDMRRPHRRRCRWGDLDRASVGHGMGVVPVGSLEGVVGAVVQITGLLGEQAAEAVEALRRMEPPEPAEDGEAGGPHLLDGAGDDVHDVFGLVVEAAADSGEPGGPEIEADAVDAEVGLDDEPGDAGREQQVAGLPEAGEHGSAHGGEAGESGESRRQDERAGVDEAELYPHGSDSGASRLLGDHGLYPP